MVPFLRDGDVVRVRAATMEDVQVGDVVCYSNSPDHMRLHRAVGRAGAALLVRGDALDFIERVTAVDVLGRVVGLERGGRVIRFDTNWSRRVNRAIARYAPWLLPIVTGARAIRRIWRQARHV